MTDYAVKKTKNPINTTVSVPGSKSITNRALLISALSYGKCKLNGVLFSDDTRVFIKALQELGYELAVDERGKCVELLNKGMTSKIDAQNAEGSVYVGSAGTAARFLTAFLALSDGKYTIDASEQMKRRPMLPLFEALEALGATFTYKEEKGFLPVEVKGCFYDGKEILSHEAYVDSDKSTQFLSALLMMAPVIANKTNKIFRIKVSGSRAEGAYVRMTVKLMRDFGVCADFDKSNGTYSIAPGQRYVSQEYDIEPDISAACYFYAASAVTGGEMTVSGVFHDSCQGDLKFLCVLEKMGCRLWESPEGIRLAAPEDGILKGLEVDMKDFSDQTMTLAAIAPYCEAPVTITGIGHIRGQESDRITATVTELRRMGIEAEDGEDYIKIYPGTPKPAHIETYNDHRIAMAFALTGLRTDGIVITNKECCKKTFEDYFEVLDAVVGKNV